jgi:hypothetical protein
VFQGIFHVCIDRWFELWHHRAWLRDGRQEGTRVFLLHPCIQMGPEALPFGDWWSLSSTDVKNALSIHLHGVLPRYGDSVALLTVMKVKMSHCTPGQALRAAGGWGSQPALRTVLLSRRRYFWYSFVRGWVSHSAAGRIKSMNIPRDSNWNRTRGS